MKFFLLEAVDPEERKLRLRKVALFARRNIKARNMARKHTGSHESTPALHHELRAKRANATIIAYSPDKHPSGSHKMWKGILGDYKRTSKRFDVSKGYPEKWRKAKSESVCLEDEKLKQKKGLPSAVKKAAKIIHKFGMKKGIFPNM